MNNDILKKISEIMIISVLISATFVACDEADDDAEITTADFAPETTVLQEDEDTRLYPDLPEYDWEGYNFRIISSGGNGNSEWDIQIPRDIAVEEETGEPFNDAIYYRNRNLEERYNFTIEHVYYSGQAQNTDTIRTAIAAGDDYFDAISESLIKSGRYAKEGLLVDLFTLEYLDLEKPWWDQGLIRDVSIMNKLFYISGDSVLINRDATAVMLFNKGLIDDYQLEDPYELVRNNQWTLAKFAEMAASAATDLNGDQIMDSTIDRFGYVSSVGDALVTGGGVRYASLDSKGIPYLTFADERNYNVLSAVYNILFSEFAVLPGGGVSIVGADSSVSEPEGIFSENRGLFFGAIVRTVERLRGAEIDFGIIPMPKYDENQQEWGHAVNTIFGGVLCVPNFGNDEVLKRTGFMLEAIASESTYTTVPAWYDVQLTTKFARDAESKEMLDIIFNSIVWDSYTLYEWGTFSTLWSAGRGTIASDWAKSIKKTETEIQATVEAFEQLD